MCLKLWLCALLLVPTSAAWSADGALNDQTWWFGNSFSGGKGDAAQWMMQSLDDFAVRGDRIYGITLWDERGGEAAIYTTDGAFVCATPGWHSWGYRGGSAVATDDKYVYYSMGHDPGDGGGQDYAGVARYTLDGKPAGWPTATNGHRLVVSADHRQMPTGLAVSDGELYVSDPARDRVAVYSTADLSHLRDLPCENPGRIAVDAGPTHALWVINTAAHTVRKIDRDGKSLGVTINDCREPSALCIDAKTGDLLVADNALDRKQIRRYRATTGRHIAGGDFGAPVYTGAKPGAVLPGRFYAITGIATDAAGDLYVGGWEYGAKLHKFGPGRKEQWVLKGLEFVSCADADPGEDTSFYSPGHRYVRDDSRAPGATWTEAAITLDPLRYPQDPRLRSDPWLAMRMYRLNGKKLMLGKPQMAANMYFWRFDGEIAVPAAMYFPFGVSKPAKWPPNHPDGPFLWSDSNGDGVMQADEYTPMPQGSQAAMVDVNGDLWVNTGGWDAGKGSITRIPFSGINRCGAPTWNLAKATSTVIPADTGIQYLSKLFYEPVQDRMYLGVWTKAHPFTGGGWEQMSVGPVIQCFSDWSTHPRLAWETAENGLLPNSPSKIQKAWSIEPDYLFAAYTRQSDQLAVDVYRTSDGKYLGALLPTAEVGGSTGWIDMNDAVQTQRCADGTYLVFVEEVWMAKGLYFRWKP